MNTNDAFDLATVAVDRVHKIRDLFRGSAESVALEELTNLAAEAEFFRRRVRLLEAELDGDAEAGTTVLPIELDVAANDVANVLDQFDDVDDVRVALVVGMKRSEWRKKNPRVQS